MGEAAVVVREQASGAREPGDRRFEVRGRGVVGQARDDQGEQIEVERVPLVVCRQLAVSAVGRDLPLDLREKNATAEGFTTWASTELRKRAARDVKGQRFADQMCVRAEVVGKVSLDLRELAIDREEEIDDPWPLVARAVSGEERQHPQPRER